MLTTFRWNAVLAEGAAHPAGQEMEADVVIVGGGLGGCAAALAALCTDPMLRERQIRETNILTWRISDYVGEPGYRVEMASPEMNYTHKSSYIRRSDPKWMS
jgi:hypothetical protein